MPGDIAIQTSVPLPRVPITTRVATMDEVPFMDRLQKMHTKMVGWMPTAQFEGKIKLGHVLIAEEKKAVSCQLLVASEESLDKQASSAPLPATGNSQLATPLGYCIGNDQYFKRDDCGIIYQMNVVPDRQR